MLKFIYGRAASGKTYKIINDISSDILNGENIVLLVPEQFTFECERFLLNSIGGSASTDVSVLSFTRLYDEITRKAGGRVSDNITDSDRIVIMNTAFKSVCDNLSVWSKYVNSSGFTLNLLSAVTEFKSAAISPEDIFSVLDGIENEFLKLKLTDIAIIYEAYNAFLGNKFLDPADDLTRLGEKLLTYRYFENKNVYIDSFKNFTGQQYKILERIIAQAKNVYISVTCNDIYSTELSVFSNVNNTVKRITDIAEKYSVKAAPAEKLEKKYYKSKGIFCLEEFLSGNSACINNSEGINIIRCKNCSDEAEFAAITIRKLVREEGYRYRDFVIIARDAERYQKFIKKFCSDNNVFCFVDKRRSIKNFPVPVFINSAFNLVKNFTTEDIINFHKTDLTDLTLEEISLIENYTYLWNIKGTDWYNEWTMNPNGFNASLGEKEDYAELLNTINSVRKKAIKPIINFKNSFNGTPKQMSLAIINLLNECNAKEHLKNLKYSSNINLSDEEAEDLSASWNSVIEIINGLVKCLPDKEIKFSEYIDLWNLSLEFVTIGNIPQTVDEVTFGSADRIKPSRPKIAFVLGVNQGVFPADAPSNGIFSQFDRNEINNVGLDISEFGFQSIIDEEFLLYSSLCCPTEKLYISYSAFDNSGNSLEPAHTVTEIVSAGFDIKIAENDLKKLTPLNLPETHKSAIQRMFASYQTEKSDYLTLKCAISPDKTETVESVIENFGKNNVEISPKTAEKLFGEKIGISATGFDTFYRCKFSYFCRYGLGLKKIQPAEFNVLQRGTLSHYVLENFVKRNLCEFEHFSKCDSDASVENLVLEYLSLINGYEQIKTPRLEFLVNIITLSLKDVAYHIVTEMLQCDFKPEFFELKIGTGGEISTVSVPFGKNGEMRLRGSIDRVDIYEDYVRIIDYKTGTKVFKLPDILVGLNLQMLIYLYTVVRGNNKYLNSKKPAGILYMPSKRDFGDPKVLSMNGLVLLDEQVISAMDKEGNGNYIPPKPFKKDGSLKKKINSYAESKLFEETFNYIELLLKRMGNCVLSGDFKADPIDGVSSDACKFCDFSSVCCFENKEHKSAQSELTPQDVMEKLKEANSNGI